MSLRHLNRSLVSPLLAFPAAWALAALLSQVHVLNAQGPWSTVMIQVVVAVPLAFIAGGLIGEALATLATREAATKKKLRVSKRGFRIGLTVLVGIGLLELAHQFAKAGTIPVLSGSIDAARFGQGGPTILLTDLLTVAAIVALVKPRRLFAREARFELGIATVAIGGFALQAGRGSVILPVIVALVGRWLYWGRPNAYVLTTGGVVAFVAIVAGFYLRIGQHPTTPFEAELFSEILPTLPFFVKPLIPLYLAVTTNFLALQGVVGHFPTVEPYGHWVFNAVAFDDFLSSTRNVSDVSATLTPPWVTSTVAGSFWADGGFPVLIPGVALIGMLSAGAYAAAVRTLSLRWAMVSAYLFFVALFGLYTNLWTQHLDWLVVSPLLLFFGAFSEDPDSPPGVVGRAWGKIRRMSGRDPKPTTPGEGDGSSEGQARLRRVAPPMVAGFSALVVLFLVGLAVQATLPPPYPLGETIRLPPSVARAQAVMSDGDRPTDNTGLWWVNTKGDRVSLRYFDPSHPDEPAVLVDRFRQPGAASSSFDITRWPPLRGAALIVMQQQGNNLEITVRRTDGKGVHQRFTAPIPAPSTGATRDLAIATFNGRIPDLFVIGRDEPNTRVSVSIISGESGFRRQPLATSLPFGGLAPSQWSLDVGSIAGQAPGDVGPAPKVIRSDLVLVEHDPSHVHANLKVLLGEDDYRGFAFQRDLDTSPRVGKRTSFLIASHGGAEAIYEVEPVTPKGPLLKIFGLEPPPGRL
jgi:hypothetical protein